MRQTLLFGGLENIQHNANRKVEDLRFFEYGNCYYFDPSRRNPEKTLSAYSEDYHLGLWLAGKSKTGSWIHAEEKADIYTLKAHVLNIFKRTGLSLSALRMQENINGELLSAAITYTDHSGKKVAEIGIVRHDILHKFDIQGDVFYADINWTNLMKLTSKNKVYYSKLSKFPPVDSSVKFAEIERTAYASEKKLLKSVELFDVYEGDKLPAGKKSYAVNFILEDKERTLTDTVINKVIGNILHNLESKLGAQQR